MSRPDPPLAVAGGSPSRGRSAESASLGGAFDPPDRVTRTPAVPSEGTGADPLRSAGGLRPEPPETRLAGGIVAHNEEGHVAASIASLLDQELPESVRWTRVWVVASGCTDRTVEIVKALAERDPRITLLVEEERRGKASAIREVLRRAEGDYLILLNADARAEPGAIAELVRVARPRRPPFAVMGRPIVPELPDDDWSRTLRWMWDLHHELHLAMLEEGEGAHLSDELLLLSLPAPFELEPGIINDGSYLAVWLTGSGGRCWYAPESRVRIEAPRQVSEHLWQRRRIHVGNAQVRRALGRSPSTLPRYWMEEPARATQVLRAAVSRPSGTRHLARIAFWELVGHALALWDRTPPRRDHVRWRKIRSHPTRRSSGPPGDPHRSDGQPFDPIERRVRTILCVAEGFSVGVPLDRLVELLPRGAPRNVPELERWLRDRPGLARLEAGRAFGPRTDGVGDPDRALRGESYRRWARELVEGPLSAAGHWVLCVGITGSTAYGEPQTGDDLDLFVVTRRGSLWIFLATTYLSLRLHRWSGASDGRPLPCFNLVLEDLSAQREFGRPQGFLFARESLAVRLLEGDDYYGHLLGRAPWIGEWFPRLYAERARSLPGRRPAPAPALARALNAVIFPWLASYLQLAGLWRSSRRESSGRGAGSFRTVTGPGQLAFRSQRFEQIRRAYEPNLDPTAVPGAAAAPSRWPTAR